ncbi:hypothetical protein [Fibrobacter sp. UWB3]|uniref:hypothetical protein n=1 Tax=Fibrobacter sp. UWB3 TaxID=1964357 RepID=UPI001595AC42|nr:hypothetical protein [Fibrobacter sp. UWB3]
MSIIIGADIAPSASNKNLFVNGDIASLVGNDLINVLRDSDLKFVVNKKRKWFC